LAFGADDLTPAPAQLFMNLNAAPGECPVNRLEPGKFQ
jgi:hypothetical protein